MFTRPNFVTRQLPTSGVGVDVSMCRSAEDALRYGGVDWGLETSPVFDEYGSPVDPYRFIRRSDTRHTFGIVKDGYRPIQPTAAFSLVDGLLAEGCQLDKLGAYKHGEIVWANLTMPSIDILGEPFTPYIFVLAGNNGKQAVTVQFTTVRAWCCNMMRLVGKHSFLSVNISHRGNLEYKFATAHEILTEAMKYYNSLEDQFRTLRETPFTRDQVIQQIQFLLPPPKGKGTEELSDRVRETLNARRNQLYLIWRDAPDLQNEPLNGYRFLNAVSDFVSHTDPERRIGNWRETRLMNMVSKPTLVDKAYRMLTETELAA